MSDWWLVVALIGGVCGMAWFALALPAHWQQACGARPRGRATRSTLRALGAAALVASLVSCLRVDHPSMAALVWVMTLTASALLTAFVLAWRPGWLSVLVAWAGDGC